MSVSERIPQVLYVHLVATKLTKRFEPPSAPRTQRSSSTLMKPTITLFREHSADGLRDLILALFASWRFFVSSARYEVARYLWSKFSIIQTLLLKVFAGKAR